MMIVSEPLILSTFGVSSCIGLALRDCKSSVSELAHVLLPNSKVTADAHTAPRKYSDTAVKILTKGLISTGAESGIYLRKWLIGRRLLQTEASDPRISRSHETNSQGIISR
jgi:chemotaxis protein CheD